MRKKSLIFAVAILAFLWSVSLAQAHMFWLNVNHDHAKVGEPVQVDIGFGHKFPQGEQIKAERLAFIKAVAPDGQPVALKKISTSRYELVPKTAGVYVISAQMAPGFVTRTPKGMKLGSKKGVPDANFCFHFDMAAKTLVSVGNPQQGFSRHARNTLEIIPQKSLNTLKAGDILPVKVMYEGKALKGAEVRFTHDSWPDPNQPFATLGKADTQGKIQIKSDKSGRWLLIASHKTPYPDPEECDENLYSSSLAYRVR
jgi:nickel transport protein